MKRKLTIKIFLFSLCVMFFLPNITTVSAVEFKPQVSIPGSQFKAKEPVALSASTKPIADYIQAVYNYLIAIVGITAAIALMFGGVIWLTAGGSSEKVSQAKGWITSSLTGLTLALSSYIILYTINPQLVSFTAPEIQRIDKITFDCKIVENKDMGLASDTTSQSSGGIQSNCDAKSGYEKKPFSYCRSEEDEEEIGAETMITHSCCCRSTISTYTSPSGVEFGDLRNRHFQYWENCCCVEVRPLLGSGPAFAVTGYEIIKKWEEVPFSECPNNPTKMPQSEWENLENFSDIDDLFPPEEPEDPEN